MLADSAKAHAISAGTPPVDVVHPEVIAAMREVGIGLSQQTPQRLTDEIARNAQHVITMGCGDQCPVLPEAKPFDSEVDDPKRRSAKAGLVIRDDIRARVERLIEEEHLSR
jgi:arsenate reductase